MKRICPILLIFFFLTGCATMLMEKGGKLPTNPIMELEIDLVFLDELAAMTKLNQIMLERMPVSLEDKWPELLNHYTKKPGRAEKENKDAYDTCLTQLLKEDFTFFKIYNPLIYTTCLARSSGLLESLMMGTRATIFIEAAKALGRRYEHAKLVLGYLPFGCKCTYYSKAYHSGSPKGKVGWIYGELISFGRPRVAPEVVYVNASRVNIRSGPGTQYCVIEKVDKGCHLTVLKRRGSWYKVRLPGSLFCQRKKKECAFFYKSTGRMLYTYLFAKGGFNSWVDLQISPTCFRVVEGEHLGTFKEVFYTLLPEDKQDEIKGIDEELAIARIDLEQIKARLKDKKLAKEEKAVLKKRKAELKRDVKNKEAIQKRLYKEALTTIEVTPEKIKKAKKLLEIAKFIDGNFSRIATAMTFLTVKIIDDIAVWGYLKPKDISQVLSSLVIMGIIVGPDARALSQERFKLLGKRVVTLPVNYFSIWGHAIAQKKQVAKYKGYLEAMVKMEEKI